MAIYSWTGIASNFPRNQRVYKLRWDTSIVCTDLTAPNGMIAEAPNIDCDGISWRDATAATPYAYAGKNRFSLTQDFMTNRVGGYTDQYFTALTISTLVSGTTYEVILPSTQAYYWGGLGNVSDYTLGTQKVHLAKEVSALSFPQSGSTIEFVFDEVGTWTYTAPQWLTVTSAAGYSNELVLTATTTANTSTSRLSGNIVFTDGSNTITLPVSQKAESSGSGGGVYLGGLGVSGCYLGASAIQGCYLGSTYIFPQAQDARIKYNADVQVTPNVAYSDSGWTTPLSSETYDSATSAGTVSFSGTGTTIPDNAYSGTSLTSVSLGKGVVSIGVSAFANCSSLLTISIPRTVTSIGNNAFAYGGLMRVEVPNSVTTLGTDLFSHDTLLESAVLPKDLTSIPAGTFYGCGSLSAVTIPSGVTSIGSNAFRNTSSLTAITIPAGVTDVALNAFQSSALKEITFESTTPPTVHNNSFNVTSATGVIKCPASAVATYTNWLTTTLSGQSISGWTVSANAPSEAAFMFNYNAKQYDSTTRTFPKTNGQLFDEDLVLDMAPTSYNSDSVSFVGSTARMDKTYSGSSANPFNRNSTNTTFTMVYKVGTFTNGSKNLFANRERFNYNYMVRGSCFHTSNSSFLNMIPQSDPYILLVRIKADGSSERSVLDASGNVLQTVTASSVSWGSNSSGTEGVSFFSGKVGGGENFDGIFYWMYLSNEALSDADVQQVISFNENL